MAETETTEAPSAPNAGQMPVPVRLTAGDYAPRHVLAEDGQTALFDLDLYAGRFTLLAFMGSLALPDNDVVLKTLKAAEGLFTQPNAQFVGVGVDVQPGRGEFSADSRITMVRDPEFRIAQAFGALQPSPEGGRFTPLWMILDPAGRVRDVLPMGRPDRAFEIYMQVLKAASLLFRRNLPVLEQPRVIEAELCQGLIDELAPKLIEFDEMPGVSFVPLSASQQAQDVVQRLERRVAPAVRNAFDFPAKTIENMTFVRRAYVRDPKIERVRIRAQAAMRDKLVMAVWMPLDEYSYRGGNLSFPEFSDSPQEVPQGAALVHSGLMLRQVSPVDSEHRYFLEALIKG